MNTNDLIDSLAKELEPATPLWRPSRRAVVWSLGAVFYVAMLVIAMRWIDRGEGGEGWLAGLPQLAAVVAGVLASVAAFVSVVPGLPRRAGVWAGAAASVWLSSLVLASPGEVEWRGVLAASHEWTCTGIIVVGGAPLLWGCR